MTDVTNICNTNDTFFIFTQSSKNDKQSVLIDTVVGNSGSKLICKTISVQ